MNLSGTFTTSSELSATAPREFGRWQMPARKVLQPIFHRAWNIEVSGADNIPADGPAILCANHTSVIDSFFLPLALDRRVTFVGKAEYLDDWKTRKLFPNLGMVPIDRSGGHASTRALDTAARLLDAGELFAIYPEGTRSRSGSLHKGHTGPARLALRTGAPIIPIGLVGTREIQPPDQAVPSIRKPAAVHIGKPIELGHYNDRADDRLVLRQIIDEVMFEIQRLSGQEYINEYANKPKDSLEAPREVVRTKAPELEVPELAPRSSQDVLRTPTLV